MGRAPVSGRTWVRRRGMTPLPNATVHDPRLSYAALGLLAVILARPESAPQGYRALVGRGLGEKAVQQALRELTDAGYRHQFTTSSGASSLRTDTVVSEDPITREEAEAFLKGHADTLVSRAAGGAARDDQARRAVAPGHHVRRASLLDSTRRDAAPRTPTGSKVTHSLRSEPPDEPTCDHGRPMWQRCRQCPEDVVCEHGTPRRYSACALCKPRPAPAQPFGLNPPPADYRGRAAALHLED